MVQQVCCYNLAFGLAIDRAHSPASAIWNAYMPTALEEYLPFVTPERRAELFGSITAAASYPMGDPVRTGVIAGMSPSEHQGGTIDQCRSI